MHDRPEHQVAETRPSAGPDAGQNHERPSPSFIEGSETP